MDYTNRFNGDYEYTEQPIRRTGNFRNASGNVPKRILQMEALYDPGLSTAEDKRRNFYAQAKFMEDYELECTQTCTFTRWFPTYHDMREDQLMAYFGWRTKVRRGEYQETQEAFAYIYLYELLNQIGVSDAEDGFRKLQTFREEYAVKYKCNELCSFLDVWMKQYCICYALSAEITAKYYATEIEVDCVLHGLSSENASEEEIYKALCAASAYKADGSVMVKKYPAEYKSILCRLWRYLNALPWMQNGENLFTACFGRKDKFVTRFFSNAVYFDRIHEDLVYEVDPERIFSYQNGKWYCECYRSVELKSRVISDILREADRQMRDAFGTGRAVKAKETDGRIILAVQKVIADYMKEKEEASRPKIVINTSILSGIRKDAAITREKLLTEEERGEEQDIPEVKQETAVKKEYPYGLEEDEVVFLRMLCAQEDWQTYLRGKHKMVSVVCENINEKMFDEFGDTVIMFDGDIPEVQEYYIEDVEKIWEEE